MKEAEGGVGGGGTWLRITEDVSEETMPARGEWNKIFKVFNQKNHQTRILYQQNYPSKVKEKQRLSLTCKKRSKKFFRQKEHNTAPKLGLT